MKDKTGIAMLITGAILIFAATGIALDDVPRHPVLAPGLLVTSGAIVVGVAAPRSWVGRCGFLAAMLVGGIGFAILTLVGAGWLFGDDC